MTNTSATGGYLLATAEIPEAEDGAFLDFLHDVLAGITGLPATLVRPRFQPSPPTMPPAGTDWLAFGIVNRVPDKTGLTVESDDGARAIVVQYEDAELLCSFYGNHADDAAVRLRVGLLLGQNRDALTGAAVAIKFISGPVQAPELVKQNWLYRTDLTVTLRRQVRRVYPILSILTGAGEIVTDRPPTTTPFSAGA